MKIRSAIGVGRTSVTFEAGGNGAWNPRSTGTEHRKQGIALAKLLYGQIPAMTYMWLICELLRQETHTRTFNLMPTDLGHRSKR